MPSPLEKKPVGVITAALQILPLHDSKSATTRSVIWLSEDHKKDTKPKLYPCSGLPGEIRAQKGECVYRFKHGMRTKAYGGSMSKDYSRAKEGVFGALNGTSPYDEVTFAGVKFGDANQKLDDLYIDGLVSINVTCAIQAGQVLSFRMPTLTADAEGSDPAGARFNSWERGVHMRGGNNARIVPYQQAGNAVDGPETFRNLLQKLTFDNKQPMKLALEELLKTLFDNCPKTGVVKLKRLNNDAEREAQRVKLKKVPIQTHKTLADFHAFVKICQVALHEFDNSSTPRDGDSLPPICEELTAICTLALFQIREKNLRLACGVGSYKHEVLLLRLAEEILLFQSVMLCAMMRSDKYEHISTEEQLLLCISVNAQVMRATSWLSEDWELKNIIGVCLAGARAGEQASILIRCSAS
jgi:hypothetical protein